MNSISKFVEERNKALFSMDKDIITAYFEKRGAPCPQDEIVFWAVVHKCICNITDSPLALRLQSERWLQLHGMSPEIF